MAHSDKLELHTEDGDAMASKKLDHLRYIHALAEHYKDSIYSRSQLLLVITGAQLASTFAIVNHVSTANIVPGLPMWFRVLIVVTLSIQLVAGIIILKTIMPHGSLREVGRIIASRTNYTDSFDIVWLMSSFNHVCKKERDDFQKIIANSTLTQLFDDLTITYYNLCHIVNERYISLRRGAILQMIGLFFLIIEAIAAFLYL